MLVSNSILRDKAVVSHLYVGNGIHNVHLVLKIYVIVQIVASSNKFWSEQSLCAALGLQA